MSFRFASPCPRRVPSTHSHSNAESQGVVTTGLSPAVRLDADQGTVRRGVRRSDPLPCPWSGGHKFLCTCLKERYRHGSTHTLRYTVTSTGVDPHLSRDHEVLPAHRRPLSLRTSSDRSQSSRPILSGTTTVGVLVVEKSPVFTRRQGRPLDGGHRT